MPATAWTVMAIPQDVDAGASGDFASLRLLDDRNKETPYILDPVLRDEPLAPRHDDRILRAKTNIEDRDGASLITIDLGRAHHETSKVVIETTTPEFSRDVALFTSENKKEWRYAGGGRVERFAVGHPTLTIAVRERTRYLRVQITNASDPPLENLAAAVYGPRHYLIFAAKAGRTYHLSRAESASAPRYDLQTLMEHDHPLLKPPVKRSERAAINIAFGAAVSIVFAITLLTLRFPRRPE